MTHTDLGTHTSALLGIKESLEGGCTIPELISASRIIADGCLFSREDVEILTKIYLKDPNLQIVRSGLIALMNKAPTLGLWSYPIFVSFLDHEYEWCRYDAIRGLAKLIPFINTEVETKLIQFANDSDHEATKKVASQTLEALEAFKKPRLKTYSDMALGVYFELPDTWKKVDDLIVDLFYKDSLCSGMEFKVAELVLPPAITSLDEIITANKKHYVKEWLVQEEWAHAGTGGKAMQIVQALKGFKKWQQTRIYKIFALRGDKILILTFSHPVYVSPSCTELLTSLTEKVRLI